MTVENLLYTLAGVGVGFAAGMAVQVWWVRDSDGGRRVRVQLASHWHRAFFLAIGLLSVFSVALTARANDTAQKQTEKLAEITTAQQQQVARQTFCNRELIRVININTDLNAENARLLDELLVAVGEQVTSTAGDREARRTAVAVAFDAYLTAKQKNIEERQPYPPPDCGDR